MGWVREVDSQGKLKLVHAEDFSMSLQQCKIPLVQLCAVRSMPFKVSRCEYARLGADAFW